MKTLVWFARILGLAAIAWGIFMTSHLGDAFGVYSLPRGIKSPILAMELAANRCDVEQILMAKEGKCEQYCPAKADEMDRQQRFDFIFIALYLTYFLALALLTAQRLGAAGWVLAVVILAGAAAGAYFDVRENQQILSAVDTVAHTPRPATVECATSPLAAIREDAYRKWTLVAVTIAFAIPLFAFWNTPSLALTLLRLLICAVAAATAITGGLAALTGEDARIEFVSKGIALTLLGSTIFWWTVNLWQGGTLHALDQIAGWPLFRQLANFPPSGEAMLRRIRERGRNL